MQNFGKTYLTYNVSVWMAMSTVLLFLLVMSSCSSLRKAPRTTETRRPFPEKIDPIPSADTLAVIEPLEDTMQEVIGEIPPPSAPEVAAPALRDMPALFQDQQRYFKEAYRIAVLLPFMADTESVHTSNRVAQWANDFYLGFQQALQSQGPSMPTVVVDVMDTQGSEARVRQIIKEGKLENVDVIVGPYRSNVAQVLSEYIRDRPIVMLSPYSAQTTLGAGIPQYMQGSPSLERHLETVFQYIRLIASSDMPVVFVSTLAAGESARPGMWRRLLDPLPERERALFTFQTIDASDLSLSNMAIDNLLPGMRGAHVVFPSWDERPVAALMRKLVAEKLEKEVHLYGLQQWRNFDGIQSAHLQALNVVLSSGDYTDMSSPQMRELSRRFVNAYHQPITSEAVWGYQMGRYVVERLYEDGALFQRFLPLANEQDTQLPTGQKQFQIVKDADGLFSRIENRRIVLIRFQDGTFVPVK
jgi:hypothetical protein